MWLLEIIIRHKSVGTMAAKPKVQSQRCYKLGHGNDGLVPASLWSRTSCTSSSYYNTKAKVQSQPVWSWSLCTASSYFETRESWPMAAEAVSTFTLGMAPDGLAFLLQMDDMAPFTVKTAVFSTNVTISSSYSVLAALYLIKSGTS